jgi:O-antigen ligase
MIILITVGICSFNSVQKRGLSSIQWLGLIYLLWQLIGLLVNGYGTTSLLLLPVQLAIFVGILIGLSNDYARKIDHLQFCHILGAIGIGLTAFHATALILAPQPFLAGRFKSYYLLPTNFANGYAPFLVAILWLAMHEKGRFVSTLAWATLPIGLGLLILSGTRNSILIALVAVIVFSVIWPKRIMVMGTIGALLTIPLLILLVNDSSQIDGLFKRFSKLEASNRHDVWALAWDYIMQRPLLGYGMGKAGEVLGQTLQSWERAEYINTHNAYLGVWLQHGIIGLILVGMIILSGLIKGWRMLASSQILPDSKEILALPVALLAGLATGGMFEEYLTSRGSVQQLLWGLSLLMILTASRSDSFAHTK